MARYKSTFDTFSLEIFEIWYIVKFVSSNYFFNSKAFYSSKIYYFKAEIS